MKIPKAKNCENCAKLYQPKHAKGRFCGATCRTQWNRKKIKANLDDLKASKVVKHTNTREGTENPLNSLKNSFKISVEGKSIEDNIIIQNIILKTFFPYATQHKIKASNKKGEFIQSFLIEKKEK